MTKLSYTPDDAAKSVLARLEVIMQAERYVRAVAERYKDIGPFWTELERQGGEEAVLAIRELLQEES